jgi:hypothetical protein
MEYQVILLVNDKIDFECIDKAKKLGIFGCFFFVKELNDIHVDRFDRNYQNRQF